MQFFKMQNCGNDYIFVFERLAAEDIVKLCDRNFGIGGDGVVYIYKKGECFGYEIYNSDGSRATFCGSVTLALGLYLFKTQGKMQFDLLTDAGLKSVRVFPQGKAIKVAIEVGKPHFQEKIASEKVFDKLLLLRCGNRFVRVRATIVDVGNLHLVIKGLYSKVLREKIVRAIGKSGLFKGGINIEFCKMRKNTARVIVYERGSGKTLCCSSGGAAVFAVLNKTGECGERLIIEFEGGKITAEMKENGIVISAYPKLVFSGRWEKLCE